MIKTTHIARTINCIKVLPLFLLLVNCRDRVEVAVENIDNHFESHLLEDIRSVAPTMQFYLYSVPENYWYPKGTSVRDVIDDEFRHGYRRLEVLDTRAADIATSSLKIQIAVDTLRHRIDIFQREIRETQRALDQMNSIFGFGLYGGMGGLLDLGGLIGGGTSREVEEMAMPLEIGDALSNLFNIIDNDYSAFVVKLFDFECAMVDCAKATSEQRHEIRNYIITKVRGYFNIYFTGTDEEVRDKVFQRIIDRYTDRYPF